jgi:hypothetical protein
MFSTNNDHQFMKISNKCTRLFPLRNCYSISGGCTRYNTHTQMKSATHIYGLRHIKNFQEQCVVHSYFLVIWCVYRVPFNEKLIYGQILSQITGNLVTIMWPTASGIHTFTKIKLRVNINFYINHNNDSSIGRKTTTGPGEGSGNWLVWATITTISPHHGMKIRQTTV